MFSWILNTPVRLVKRSRNWMIRMKSNLPLEFDLLLFQHDIIQAIDTFSVSHTTFWDVVVAWFFKMTAIFLNILQNTRRTKRNFNIPWKINSSIQIVISTVSSLLRKIIETNIGKLFVIKLSLRIAMFTFHLKEKRNHFTLQMSVFPLPIPKTLWRTDILMMAGTRIHIRMIQKVRILARGTNI